MIFILCPNKNPSSILLWLSSRALNQSILDGNMWCRVCWCKVIELFYVWNCVTMWSKCIMFCGFSGCGVHSPGQWRGWGPKCVRTCVSQADLYPGLWLSAAGQTSLIPTQRQTSLIPPKWRGDGQQTDPNSVREGWTAACVWFSHVDKIDMNLLYLITLCIDHLFGEYWW